MPLKESKGNMYQGWVTHTHTHLGGECPHKCVYCYVDNPRWGRPKRYTGKLRLIDSEFKVNYGTRKVIFVEHCNDLFAQEVPQEFVIKICAHCDQYPGNTYVFQTKNPARFLEFSRNLLPASYILGCTIETNRPISAKISLAPQPETRMLCMEKIVGRKFITIEPVMDFDVDVLASWIDRIRPEFLNLGADSKGHSLSEPTVEKVMALTRKLQEYGIELREKHNLSRLK